MYFNVKDKRTMLVNTVPVNSNAKSSSCTRSNYFRSITLPLKLSIFVTQSFPVSFLSSTPGRPILRVVTSIPSSVAFKVVTTEVSFGCKLSVKVNSFKCP